MNKSLYHEEKRNNKLKRDKKSLNKKTTPKLDERCYEMLRILRDAPNHPEIKYNSKYFENHFHTSNVTILRAAKTLKDMDLLEKKQIHGSYVIKKSVEQVYSQETKKNIALIASLKGLLQQYKNTPLFEQITKLIYFLEPKVAKEDSVLSSSRIIVPPGIEYDINISNWEKIYFALQNNHKIQFRYTKPYTNNKALRIVRPYQLILDNGSVYLFAYSDYTKNVLLYDINYMTNILITKEIFELPDNYDFNNYLAGGKLGAFKADYTPTFVIKFTGYAKEWIKHHKWAENQK